MTYKKSEIKDKRLEISYGFTLVELLVVIAIIAILFAVVLVAINPAQRFKDSRNARRLSDVGSIVGAVTTYTADKRGVPPADIPDGQCIGSKPATVVSDINPVPRAHWKFDNDATSSVGGFNGTTSEASYADPAKLDQGLMLKNPIYGISVADTVDDTITSGLTLEGWIKLNQKVEPGSFDHNQVIFDKGNYRLQLNSDSGKIEWYAQNSTLPSWSAPQQILLGEGEDTDGDGIIDTNDPDDDNDSFGLTDSNGQFYFRDEIEEFIGTDKNVNCGPDAWPPDFNNDGVTDVIDLVAVSTHYGIENYSVRYDLNADGVIDGADSAIIISIYKSSCGISGINNFKEFNGSLYASAKISKGPGRILKKKGSIWGGVPEYSSVITNLNALETYNGKLYVGHSSKDNKARIYAFDGVSWQEISPQNGAVVGDVLSFARYQEKLYAGIGSASGASVWMYDGTSWSIAKQFSALDAVAVYAMTVFNGKLYAGTGRGATNQDARVFEYDGNAWTQRFVLAKDGAYSLAEYNKELYVGFGGDNSATDAVIYKGNGAAFSQIGSALSGSTAKSYVYSLGVFNGILFAGIGGSAGDGDVYFWDGSAWNMDLNNASSAEIRSLYSYQGKFYAGGLGATAAQSGIWTFGNNGFIESQKSKWLPNVWYHIAGVYDGTNSQMKILINGAVDATQTSGVPGNIAANTQPLYLGIGYASDAFSGTIDDFAVHHTVVSDDIVASHAGCYNLGQYLVSEYMGALPIDPSSSVTDGTDTGYMIYKDPGGVVTITAPLTEITSSVPEFIKASR